MEWYTLLLIVILATVSALLVLWLFLIAPRARKAAVRPFLRPYAHRGLWGEGVPENSLAAFARAADEGFAIELDVRLAADGTVMVFHDDTLDRMCGVFAPVSERTAEELGTLSLGGTAETVPTFRQVLDTVAGRVPLLIELKGESKNDALVPRVLAELASYTGEWCMESFNPLLLRSVKKHAPSVVRGLLSTDLIQEKRKGSKLLNFALSALWLTFLCRPAFHAYSSKYPHRIALRVGIRCFGAAPVVYTVRDEAAYNAFLDAGISPIFEGFLPERREVKLP